MAAHVSVNNYIPERHNVQDIAFLRNHNVIESIIVINIGLLTMDISQ